jgi:hypothetical protein
LLQEELEIGRALAIDELFEDPEHGFNLNGISLGTLAAAMQLAPGAPIPRDLLYAVSADAAPEAREEWDAESDGGDTGDTDDTHTPSLTMRFSRPALFLAHAAVDHLIVGGILVEASDDSLLLNANLHGRDDNNPLRVGQALAEQALLSIVPHLFDTQNTTMLRQIEAHLRHVTDRGRHIPERAQRAGRSDLRCRSESCCGIGRACRARRQTRHHRQPGVAGWR